MTHELVRALFAASANPAPTPWRIVTKMAFFIGLIGAFGGSLLHGLVLAPVLSRTSVDPGDRAVLRRRATVLLGGIGIWFLMALYFQMASVVARKGTPIPYGDALSPDRIWQYLTASAQPGQTISTGLEAALQYGLWAVAALLLVILLVPRLGAYVDALAWMSAGTTFVAWSVTAVPTELGKTTVDSVADGLIDHVHVVAVSAWVGGIAMLALLAITSHRHLTPAGAEVWARLWPRFSIVALVAVGCVLVSGAWLSWKHLGSPSELFDTSFGRVLLLKVSLVAVMIAVGAINEFLLMPRIARARAAGAAGSVFRLAVRVFPRLVALEALLALGVLFVLSFLTGSGRTEAGDDPDPMATGTVVALGVVLAAVIAVSFTATTKVSARLSRTRNTAGDPDWRQEEPGQGSGPRALKTGR
jgi:copper transport protein